MLEPGDVAGFLGAVLEREGALAQVDSDGRLEVVLGPELQAATDLGESATLRLLANARAGEQALALESKAVQWCLESALARGSRACMAIPGVRPRASGVADAVLARFHARNCAVRDAVTRQHDARVLVLEFRYEAIGEERAEGSVHVACDPALRTMSAPLAAMLLAELARGSAGSPRVAATAVAAAAGAASRHAQRLLGERLQGLRRSLTARMARDAARITDYHETLLREGRKRARGVVNESREAKAQAILRSRDEKLRELALRYQVTVRWSLASVLEVAYPVSICEFLLLRRKREILVALPWDPFLQDVPGRICDGCGEPEFGFEACDEAGHLTCVACARACARCGKRACRTCHPDGCRGCGAA